MTGSLPDPPPSRGESLVPPGDIEASKTGVRQPAAAGHGEADSRPSYSERQVQASGEDSFPASDPPSWWSGPGG